MTLPVKTASEDEAAYRQRLVASLELELTLVQRRIGQLLRANTELEARVKALEDAP